MFTNLVTVLVEAPDAARDTQELIVGSGCILLVIAVALWAAYRTKK